MVDETHLRMLDTIAVPEVFVSGLGEVENIGGGCFRFTFYSKQHVGDRQELVVVAKLIAPMEAVPPALIMAAKAVGYSFARNAVGKLN